jgi:hypothetical protein
VSDHAHAQTDRRRPRERRCHERYEYGLRRRHQDEGGEECLAKDCH